MPAPQPRDDWPLPAGPRAEAETVVGMDAPPPGRRRFFDDHLALGLLAVLVLALLAAGAAYYLHHRGHASRSTTTVVVTTTKAAAPAVKKLSMPSLVGSTREQALARLRQLGLPATVVMRAGSGSAGTVLSESPAAAASVRAGSPVTLVVASGPEKIAVPSLVGRTLRSAESAVRALGLKVATTQATSAKPAGTVVDQAPKPGGKVAKGGLVTLSVAKGAATTTGVATTTSAAPAQPRTATVPDVNGQTEAAAVQALAQAGILPSLVFVAGSDPLGTVEAQAKPAGTTVPYRSHLQINVSRGPDAAASERVPNVVGATLQQALATVNGAHLRLIYVKLDVPRAQAGKIVQQSPLPGGGAPERAQVLVFLGVYRP